MRLTAHAILRYLERIKGIDVDAIREHYIKKFPRISKSDSLFLHWLDETAPGIINLTSREIEARCAEAADAGATHLKSSEGVFIFSDSVLLTVLTPEQFKKSKGRKFNASRVDRAASRRLERARRRP
jgi:hypothetical protein